MFTASVYIYFYNLSFGINHTPRRSVKARQKTATANELELPRGRSALATAVGVGPAIR